MCSNVIRRGARREDVPAILELTCAAYGEGLQSSFYDMLCRDPDYCPDQSLVAEVDGRIASHIRIADRTIRYGDVTLPMAGIGSVATSPDYRGQGLATALLADTIDHIRHRGYLVSMLFTGIQPFYARLGWAPFPTYTFRCEVLPTSRPIGASGYSVRPFDLDRDLTAVKAIYDSYNRGRTCPCVRNSQYWLSGPYRDPDVLPKLVAEQDGIAAAYASFQPHGDTLWLYEAGCRGDAAPAFLSLARAVIQQAVATESMTIEGALPCSHGLLAALHRLSPAPIEGQLREHMMLRVVDLHGLFQAARPTFSRRLSRRAPRTSRRLSLGFSVGGEYVRFTIDHGRMALDAEPADHVLALDTDLFFRLFLGDRPLALLTEELAVHGIDLMPEERNLLDALFPPQDPVYWEPDQF
jgi:predicted acetyltransferase